MTVLGTEFSINIVLYNHIFFFSKCGQECTQVLLTEQPLECILSQLHVQGQKIDIFRNFF